MKQDLIASIGAVRRGVRDLERDGAPARAVVAERTFDTTVEDVWDAVTNPERIPRWFLPVEGDLRVGGRYQLEGNAGGEVTACEPPTHFAVTWEFGGGVTWLDVVLGAHPDGGTLLRLEHVAPVDDDSGMWDQFGPGAVGIGWDLGLLGLGEHLLTGETVDPAAVAEVMASPAGVDLMTRSSEAWGEADIASGTPEADARGRAERTVAAYTGEGAAAETSEGEAPEGEGPSVG